VQAALSGAGVAHLEERNQAMYLSRLTFHTLQGKTGEGGQEFQSLVTMVGHFGGIQPSVLRNHFASLGAPDVVFDQEVPDLEMLEHQIQQVTENSAFQQCSGRMSGLSAAPPKSEVYRILA
jgi:hypothetical protein